MKSKSPLWIGIACLMMIVLQPEIVHGVEFGSKTRRLERSKEFVSDEKNEKNK